MYVRCMLSCAQDSCLTIRLPGMKPSKLVWWRQLGRTQETLKLTSSPVKTLLLLCIWEMGNRLWKAFYPDSRFKQLGIRYLVVLQDLSLHPSVLWLLAQCILISPGTNRLCGETAPALWDPSCAWYENLLQTSPIFPALTANSLSQLA